MIQARTLIAAGMIGSAIAACTNEPGAVRLELSPLKSSFSPNEPIAVTATLKSDGHMTCLSKHRNFKVNLHRSGDRAVASSERPVNENVAGCGTGILATYLFMPWLPLGALFDVADAAGRFDLLRPGVEPSEVLCVNHEPEPSFITIVHGIGNDGSPGMIGPWLPGEYELEVSLVNGRAFCGDFLPLPLGWQLYSQPVTATVAIRVVNEVVPVADRIAEME